ncbi:hypothetical protein K501DRAFT_203707 [Backusella circina FSU 941]|nr:hypothetical protein K501DRAFT_203707 [Backusella circina FSU 941]
MKEKFTHFLDDIKSADVDRLADKRIAIVAIHGWYPVKLVSSIIGEPTGTSFKFCEQMATAVRLYFEQEHQVTLPADAMTLVPLEGEGKVHDRVNHLYNKLLENSVWLEAVSSADVILWATHSQGTPVSVMLLERLLEKGLVHTTRQSLCMLTMAGISHGPFPSLKGSLIVKYFEADSARELFEFMDSKSTISLRYRQALEYVLKRDIQMVMVGSMQDQVVPLYSSIMTTLIHPNILRHVYIDGSIYSEDDFLISLVVFSVKLRNIGLYDHDLLIHLSEVLAGSLYALEGGHSTIYEEVEVYMTAVRSIFETVPFGPYERRRQQQHILMEEDNKVFSGHFQAVLNPNPFYLPWALRGIFSDKTILDHDELKQDLIRLCRLFEEWHPTTGRLKELKFRLDPIRTMNIM